VVLGGHTSIADPTINFHDAFSGTTPTGYGVANALYKITFAYAGYANAFNVVAEVKDPIKTIKKSAPASLLIVAVLYTLCNVAYFAAGESNPHHGRCGPGLTPLVPKAQLAASSQTAASLFFSAVFGPKAAQGLNFLVVISAFGNLVGVLIGQSRLLREVGR
jgi:amino acid transporter